MKINKNNYSRGEFVLVKRLREKYECSEGDILKAGLHVIGLLYGAGQLPFKKPISEEAAMAVTLNQNESRELSRIIQNNRALNDEIRALLRRTRTKERDE